MKTESIISGLAVCIALPTVSWLIVCSVQGTAADAKHDAEIGMISKAITEGREEDREWKKSISEDINRMANSAEKGFGNVNETLDGISKDFYELRGTFNGLEFETVH